MRIKFRKRWIDAVKEPCAEILRIRKDAYGFKNLEAFLPFKLRSLEAFLLFKLRILQFDPLFSQKENRQNKLLICESKEPHS